MGYPASSRKKVDPALRKDLQRLQELAGERRQDGPQQQAVVQGDPAGLSTIKLTAAILTVAPTTADYNALVADTRALAALLNTMGAKITWS